MLPQNFSAFLVYPSGTEPCRALWCISQQHRLYVTGPGTSDLADFQVPATKGKNISPGKQACRAGLAPSTAEVT